MIQACVYHCLDSKHYEDTTCASGLGDRMVSCSCMCAKMRVRGNTLISKLPESMARSKARVHDDVDTCDAWWDEYTRGCGSKGTRKRRRTLMVVFLNVREPLVLGVCEHVVDGIAVLRCNARHKIILYKPICTMNLLSMVTTTCEARDYQIISLSSHN